MEKKEKTEAIAGSRNQHNMVLIFPWNDFKRESRLLKESMLRNNIQKTIKT
ncbi:hypothetical protein [Chryseobacterium sp. MEBOG07]|uniref:hypothetical protein n=1 Tax=Chryseobacterium sp. MEBOG07 TaxID=2879939 RepID=UPI001F40DF73|nr:hypothetical protein [Chryseobacterium sp. MEBOG07]UKB78475.1 hypothetical protein LF886_18650 [Chryseobacterium sp. MEBOG07]